MTTIIEGYGAVNVQIKLKPRQQHTGNNYWDFTYKGELKQVLYPTVAFYAPTLEEALSSFNIDEVEELTIHAKFI